MNELPKKSSRRLQMYFFCFAFFILPILACTEPDRGIDPTLLAPQDLSGQDFSHKNFAELDLSGKIFQEAKFVNSEFYFVNFTDADLRQADFTDARGDEIDFTRADLRGAIFDNFCIYNSDIIWTDALIDNRWAKTIDLLENGFYAGQDLRGYDLSKVCLHYYDLSGVNLAGAKLTGAKLTLTDFSEANLKGVDFSGAKLQGVDFTRADLTGAKGVIFYDTSQESPIVILCNTRLPNGKISDASIERCRDDHSNP
jgi:uncharacterized protein YjbI with pentapeptide repeats